MTYLICTHIYMLNTAQIRSSYSDSVYYVYSTCAHSNVATLREYSKIAISASAFPKMQDLGGDVA